MWPRLFKCVWLSLIMDIKKFNRLMLSKVNIFYSLFSLRSLNWQAKIFYFCSPLFLLSYSLKFSLEIFSHFFKKLSATACITIILFCCQIINLDFLRQLQICRNNKQMTGSTYSPFNVLCGHLIKHILEYIYFINIYN